MKRIVISALLSIFTTSLFAQIPLGGWRDHFSYRQGLALASSDSKVFLASSNGIFWYKSSDESIGKLSRVNGLSDIDITTIAYSPFQNLLMVGYVNGNIDLVFENEVINIPYILQKPMQGSKRINHFYLDENGNAYVSTGFGIVVVNIDKREIKDTYYIGSQGAEVWVNQISVFNDRIYAATKDGLYSALVNNPLLLLFSSWSLDDVLPQGEYKSLAVFNDNLVVSQSTGSLTNDVVWYNNSGLWSELTSQLLDVKNIWANSQKLIISSRQGIITLESIPGSISTLTSYKDFTAFAPNWVELDRSGRMIVADASYGLMYHSPDGWKSVYPNGPVNNRSFHVASIDDNIVVSGGSIGSTWGSMQYSLTHHILANNEWSSIISPKYWDAVKAVKSPLNQNEHYIASWGHGVIVYRDGVEQEWYNPSNSSLETILPNYPSTRIGGLTFDRSGNLWVSNYNVNNAISVRTPQGDWFGFPYKTAINSPRIFDLIMSPWGHLWLMVVQYNTPGGFFVLNPGSNPTSQSSHTYRNIKLFDNEGANLPSDIYCFTFDRDGYLWVGTSEGVLVSYNPQRALDQSLFSIQRVKIPDVVSGLAVYLLENNTVTSIAVDGGNRKWFGTQRSGVFFQSSDGSQQIRHFTTENSPLPSNNIQHIGIHPKTGEVFFATDRGLVSYRGDATEPNNVFGKVYAFPNPVRPDYNGLISITGLVDKTIVKITDVAGNLVYETISQGGQATWDGKNKNGKRVSTGVYLFFCADSQGEQSAVGKILFVN